MDDRQIIELYFARSQQALTETQERYGDKLRRLAQNILRNPLDAAEVVNDAYLAAWNSIPPARPEPLLPWLYKTVRNLALKRYHHETAQKRGGAGFPLAYDELENLFSNAGGPEGELEAKELASLLNRFLRRLSPKDRKLFLGRYWYGETYAVMAAHLGLSENACMARVSRTRKKLKAYLTQKGAI